MTKRRVVITGLGIISSIGSRVDEFWDGIKGGKNGISPVTRIDVTDIPTKVAAEVPNFEPSDYIEKKELRRMDRFIQFAMAAAKMAIEDSSVNIADEDPYRVGVIMASGIGGIETLEQQHSVVLGKGPSRVSPFFIPMMISNMSAGYIAIRYGAKGFNKCVVSACASSANALGDAFRVIQRGDADIMIAGGSEASITTLSFAGFCSMRAMSTNPNPNSACRPFDAQRDGFVMGEGGGVLILEELSHAISRGANIAAEVVGYASTNDAYHITTPSPEGEGAAKCMELAIRDAQIALGDVGYINAHGTSTEYNDKYETAAIKKVFGEYAKKIAVSSTKSMTGHLLGAAGAIEGIISALALRDSFLPPTINYKDPDPECDLDYVANAGRKADIEYALSNSLGFGGHNVALVLKKYK